jgi:hypothetical protein
MERQRHSANALRSNSGRDRNRSRFRSCAVDLGIGRHFMRRASRRSRIAQAPRIPRGFRVRKGPHFERAGANAKSSRATSTHGEPPAAATPAAISR